MVQLGAKTSVLYARCWHNGVQNKCVFAQIYFKFSPVQALTPVNTPKALHYTNTFYVCTLCNNFLNDYTTKKIPRTAADKKKGGGEDIR